MINKLKKPIPIVEQNWDEDLIPTLTVFNWVYNHKDFIRESIESILIQKTTFKVEIIIHDDASKDGTKEIVLEYQKKHPHLFKNILQDENQWSQGKSVMKPLFEKSRGKYVALAHGDDYWIDPLKLQKQYQILENNKSIAVCAHSHLDLDGALLVDNKLNIAYPGSKWISTTDIINIGGGIVATNSIFIRTSVVQEMPLFYRKSPVGDLAIILYASLAGKVYVLNEVMSIYRKFSSESSWSFTFNKNWKSRFNYRIKMIRFWFYFNWNTGFKYFSPVFHRKIKLVIKLFI